MKKTVRIIDKTLQNEGVIFCDKIVELRIPLVLKKIEEKVDGRAENNKFNPIDAINLFELNFDIKKEKNPVIMIEDKSGKFEWTARVLNINKDYNLSLQNKCKALYDYIQFTSRINENKEKGMTNEKAIDEAIDWASEQNLLEGFIKEQKAEVKMTLLTEFNEEASIRGWRKEGMQQKAEEIATKMLSDKLKPEKVSLYSGLPLEQVLELQKHITVQA